MRYRRYYAKSNQDSSVTVVSHGPVVGAGRYLWKSVAGTFIVFVVAFALINPFAHYTTAADWWAISWGFVGASLHIAGNILVKKRKVQSQS